MITLDELAGRLGLVPVAAAGAMHGREVSGAYCSDLLSDVINGAGAGNLLITSLNHQNVIGVAVLAGLSAVIMTGGRPPEEGAVRAAGREGIPLFTTGMNNFEIAGLIHRLLYS